jgi:hypothetical protein
MAPNRSWPTTPLDQANIGSLRSHLQTVASQFAEGNHSQPAAIHSADMPGLTELQAGAARVQVGYEQIPAGARITYRTGDLAPITALHSWFDAQNTDHAMPGMGVGHWRAQRAPEAGRDRRENTAGNSRRARPPSREPQEMISRRQLFRTAGAP